MQASFSTRCRTPTQALALGATRSATRAPKARVTASRSALTIEAGSSIQFIKGYEETCVPTVNLTRSRTGSSGTALFKFDKPQIFEAEMGELGDITGMYMVDDEGEIVTTDVSANFINGKPAGIQAKYVMRDAYEWDRFMRFMERYAEDNELGFNKN
mmetsp:Transcript_10003/g.11655  ORF Transcript_10003/g.11655 Transcript_10003/m.11655 type:complete len:157 (+) Transcript_10003:61-531(+)